MKNAINTLTNRIAALNQELIHVERIIKESEMETDYFFGLNDRENIQLEIKEHQKAIELLNNTLQP